MSSHIEVAREGRVMTITMNRPEVKNALTLSMYEQMTAALTQARDDAQVRAVVFRGAGGAFTSGNDLQDFAQNPPKDENSPVFKFLSALIGAPKPLLAAVDGAAIGIGTTMLLHCDLSWASARTKLKMPFVNLALVPEAASSLLLPQIVGRARANALLLLGDSFSAEEAAQWGIINGVVGDPAALNDHVMEVATRLAAQAPEAVRLSKQLIRSGQAEAVQHALRAEADIFTQRLQSPEFMEAVQAFFQKRAPDFG